MSSLKQQGTRAFIWGFIGRIMMQGMSFIVSIFLTRLLEPSDFGLIAMVMVIIGIAGIFNDIIRLHEEERKVDYMKKNSLLVDDSFQERKEAIDAGMLAFGNDMINILFKINR